MPALSAAEVYERIARLCAATYEPVLDERDLEDLVDVAKRADRYGVLPSATGWSPTWNIDLAVADGWAIKAARAAGDFTYSDDAGNYQRAEVYEMCVDREKHYRSRSIGSLPVSPHEPLEVEVYPS